MRGLTNMVAPKRGLGRGLGALIPTELVNNVSTPSNSVAEPINANLNTVPGITFAEIDLNQIKPNAKQPRQVFEEEALKELTFSLKEIGLLQPIVVRATGNNEYEIVAGERRFRAAKLAGFTKIPALIRDTQDTHMLRDALLENLHRAQLNPLEEAAAYQQLLEDFGGTQEELAAKLGRSRPQVTNTMRLLKLPPMVQKRVAAGVLSSGHAKALLSSGHEGIFYVGSILPRESAFLLYLLCQFYPLLKAVFPLPTTLFVNFIASTAIFTNLTELFFFQRFSNVGFLYQSTKSLSSRL